MNASNKFDFKPKKETALIVAAMSELGITQKQIAKEIGRTKGTVSVAIKNDTRKARPTLSLIKSFLAMEILKRKNRGHRIQQAG